MYRKRTSLKVGGNMLAIHPAILMSLSFCGALLVYILFEEHIGKIIRRGILGSLTIVIVNYFVPSTLALTFNVWTVLVACLLGIPGVLILYIVKLVI